MAFGSPAAALVEAAGSLGPLVRAHRDEIEHTRHLPAAVVDAMAEAHLLHLYVPRAVGGLEVPRPST